ncbi:hypothetical protein BJX76DRAFT_359811 [Aspergillus varians]
MRMILERYGSKIRLSEDLLKKAARNTHWRTNVLKVFIFSGESIGQVVAVTPELVAAAAESPEYGYESVHLLRTRRSKAPFVNSEALSAAVSNQTEFSLRLLRLLFRCSQDSLPINTELLSTAAKHSVHGTEMLRLLLSHLGKQGGDEIVFEDLLKAAAANTTRGGQWADSNYVWNSPLGLLIRKERDRIKITEGVLAADAASSENGKRCVLLEKVSKSPRILFDVAVSENVLTAAVANGDFDARDKVVMLLLSHHSALLPFSELVVLAAAKYHDESIMELLLRQYQGPIYISNSTLQKVSPRLGGTISRKLQARQIHSQAPERMEWHLLRRLFLLFVSCYIWSLSHRDANSRLMN